MMDVVEGATYESVRTGDFFTVMGFKGANPVRVCGTQHVTDEYQEIAYPVFVAEYADVNLHNHEDYCCSVHGTHSMPHRGCLLR